MSVLNIVTQLELFNHFEEHTLQALAGELEIVSPPVSMELFHQGDPGDCLYIITSGELCIILNQPDGSETCLNTLGAGECVGEMSLLTGQPRTTSAVIAQEGTTLLRLSKAAFDRLSAEHPDLMPEFSRQFLQRFQGLQINRALTRVFGHLDDAALHTLQEKLEWHHLESGQVLFHQGEPGDAMYIVVQGRMRFAYDDAGQPRRVLGEVGAGESIGEFAMLAEEGTPESLRSATVYATRRTDLVSISRTTFESLLFQYPQMLLKLMRMSIRRQRSVIQPSPTSTRALVIALLPLQAGLPMSRVVKEMDAGFAPLGSTLVFDIPTFEASFGKPGAASVSLEDLTSPVVRAWLDEREGEHKYVIYDASPVMDESGQITAWARRCLEDADIILLVGDPARDPAPGPVEAALRSANIHLRTELALLHPENHSGIAHAAAWLAPRREGPFAVAAHHNLRLGNLADYRRLARRISGRPVGLVLSGGGARGYAHLGVIRALEEAGMEVDWVAGASMGSLLAACYALDWSQERIFELAVGWSNPKKLIDYTLPYSSLTATRGATHLLQTLFGGIYIEDTWRAFFCNSANLSRGEEQIHLSGLLWRALRASTSYPAVFTPLCEDGMVLVDGGAANNLPINRMREFCPTGTVIAVELITSPALNKVYNFGPVLSGWEAVLSRWTHRVTVPTILDVINGILANNNRFRLNEMRHLADLIIKVPSDQYGLMEFDKFREASESGYQAAKEQIKAWKEGKS